MAKKASSDKSGSGSQNSDKKAPGEQQDGGGATDDEEEEEEEKTPPANSDKSKDGDGKGGKVNGKQDDERDLSHLSEEDRNYIKKLRRESAKHRTKANNLETSLSQLTDRVRKVAGGGDGGEDEMSVEDRLAAHEAGSAQLAFDNGVLSAALQHGVGAEGLKYFRFLVNEKASELGEGEELSDEDLADIAEEARKSTGSGRRGTKTSVTGDEGGKGKESKQPIGKDTVTLEQFTKMNIRQKSELQKNNPELYGALFAEAVQKRQLI